MWIGLIHGRRFEKTLSQSCQSNNGIKPELVFGFVSKNAQSFSRVSQVPLLTSLPYNHYMHGPMYYGELRGGYDNGPHFQSVAISNQDGEMDDVQPTWSDSVTVEINHDWFRLVYSFQEVCNSWKWHEIDTQLYKSDITVLWYSPLNRTYRDVRNLITLDFLDGVLIVHLSSVDITYYAYRSECFGRVRHTC
jgi:hypothetical protein